MNFINDILDCGAYALHTADAFCEKSIHSMGDKTFIVFYRIINTLTVILMGALIGIAGTLETSTASDAIQTYFADAIPVALCLAILAPALNHCYVEDKNRKPRHFN